MSRIYEAMQRAAAQRQQPNQPATSGAEPEKNNVVDAVSRIVERNHGSVNLNPAPPAWGLTIGRPTPPVHTDSAPTAHTEQPVGTALSGGPASRDAGATLGAASSARQPGNFATVEISPARVEPHLVAITQPRSAYTEQFRSLRTRILNAGEKRGVQVVVVTSAGVAEGKTLTSLNLGWMLAQTEGVNALLIDSDLRRPCAANYLGLQAPHGLSEALAGKLELEQAITRLQPSGLYIMPGGEARDNVAEMLAGPTFGRLLKTLRQRFDYIIIDAPPMGVFSDANTLINRADGALLVVRANRTKYKAVERLLDGVPRERMLGVVLNHAEESLPDDGYYGYGYSYRPLAAVAQPEQLPEEVAA
jgi:capsular exopolysaccharide synthesis family protein